MLDMTMSGKQTGYRMEWLVFDQKATDVGKHRGIMECDKLRNLDIQDKNHELWALSTQFR